METKVDRHPFFQAGIGEGSMEYLAAIDNHITRVTNNRYGFRKTLSACLRNQFDNIHSTVLVAAGHNPDAIHCSTAVDLAHKVKAMNILVKDRAVPVGVAILMPGHCGAKPCIFNKQTLMKGHKVLAVNCFGHF